MEEHIRTHPPQGTNEFFDAEPIARRTAEVLREPSAFRALGRAAEQMIAAQCSLDVVLPMMTAMYEQVVANARPNQPARAPTASPFAG